MSHIENTKAIAVDKPDRGTYLAPGRPESAKLNFGLLAALAACGAFWVSVALTVCWLIWV